MLIKHTTLGFDTIVSCDPLKKTGVYFISFKVIQDKYGDLFFGIGNEKCIKSQWDGNENVITYDIGDGYLGIDKRYININSMAKNTKGSTI